MAFDLNDNLRNVRNIFIDAVRTKIKQLDYEESSSNSVLRTDSKVLDTTLHEVVVTCTRRAIPDIMRALEN